MKKGDKKEAFHVGNKEDGILCEVRRLFAEAVRRNRAQGILFSGGLDSALVAAYARDAIAVTVGLLPFSSDAPYAEAAATYLGLDHRCVWVTRDKALEVIPSVIKVLKSFDPAIPNDVAVYLGLSYAKERGMASVMTGDGSDEVFAGYSFMQELDNLESYMHRMHLSMRFSAVALGASLGIEVCQPFLDDAFFAFAETLDLSSKIGKEKGTVWGKLILRKAFEEVLPVALLWQNKRPLESGSGMTRLRGMIESMITDSEYDAAKRNYPVRFFSKEHFYYYRIYRDVVGEIPVPEKGQKRCDRCGAGMDPSAFHCRVCGSVEDWRVHHDYFCNRRCPQR